MEDLRAALAQPEPFNPDWDRVKALEESLREHMAEIQRLKALAQPEQLVVGGDDLPTLTKWTPQRKPDEKFCDSHCVWTDHHPDCVLRTAAAEEANRRANAGWGLMCKKMVAAERDRCLGDARQADSEGGEV
jgi:hypothetical protein